MKTNDKHIRLALGLKSNYFSMLKHGNRVVSYSIASTLKNMFGGDIDDHKGKDYAYILKLFKEENIA